MKLEPIKYKQFLFACLKTLKKYQEPLMFTSSDTTYCLFTLNNSNTDGRVFLRKRDRTRPRIPIPF